MALVLDLTITDHAGIVTTYDYRMRRAIQKISKSRAGTTDYFELPSNLNNDIRTDVTPDFDAQTDLIRSGRRNGRILKEKDKGGNETTMPGTTKQQKREFKVDRDFGKL